MLEQYEKGELLDMMKSFQDMMVAPLEVSHKPPQYVTARKMPWVNEPSNQQFHQFYQSRLQQFTSKFPTVTSQPNLVNISKLDSEPGKQIYSIGIIKRLEAKRVRYFDKEYRDKFGVNGNRGEDRIFSDDDQIQLEDSTGKVKLHFHPQKSVMAGNLIATKDLPFGIVVAIHGRYHKKTDRFHVEEIILPIYTQPQTPLQIQSEKRSTDWKILIASEPTENQLITLRDRLQGKKSSFLSDSINKIQSVIIIGGMKMEPNCIRAFDDIVREIAQSVSVFVMPSTITSEVSAIYPQERYRNIYFPTSEKTVTLSSNPQYFTTQNQVEILVSAGENVKDFWRNSNLADLDQPVEIMKRLIQFNHICPTTPFSIKSEAYLKDNLIISRPPHIFICGDCDCRGVQFKTIEVPVYSPKGDIIHQNVQLVAIRKGYIACISMETLKVHQIEFQ